MKHLSILLIALLFSACGESKDQEKTPKKEQNESSAIQEDTSAIEENYKWNYYAGTVGLYDEEVIVELAFSGDSVFGGYWYLKHGKKLTLSGKASLKSNQINLTESYKGKTTGKFIIMNHEDSLVGSWLAPKSSANTQNVHLVRVLNNQIEPFTPKFEKYVWEHEIWMYNFNGEDDESVEREMAEDEMNLVKIGDYVLFNYSVIGSNAHVGYISGLAKLKGNKAIFKGEDPCELSIEFVNDKTIKTNEDDCSYYRGMRAYFEGELKKVK